MFKVIIVFFFFAVAFQHAQAQEFSEIVPLKSDCEDVKRVLKVKKCTFPQSIFLLKDFWITVNFVTTKPQKTDKICYKIPAGKVASLIVSYNKPIPLSEFEYPLKFSKENFDDMDTIAYENAEKGISVFTNSGFIKTVFYQPTESEQRQFSYPCKSPDAGDDVRLPVGWFDRYWNLSRKKQQQRFREIVPLIKIQIKDNPKTQIYLVYFYSNRRDIKSGIEQANRAKEYLKLGGIEPERIKVFNGGKEDKSEIVIYFIEAS